MCSQGHDELPSGMLRSFNGLYPDPVHPECLRALTKLCELVNGQSGSKHCLSDTRPQVMKLLWMSGSTRYVYIERYIDIHVCIYEWLTIVCLMHELVVSSLRHAMTWHRLAHYYHYDCYYHHHHHHHHHHYYYCY